MATMTDGTNPIQWKVVVNTNGAEKTKKKRMNWSAWRYVNGPRGHDAFHRLVRAQASLQLLINLERRTFGDVSKPSVRLDDHLHAHSDPVVSIARHQPAEQRLSRDTRLASMSGSGGFPVASFITQSSSDTSSPFGPPTRKSRSMCRMVAYRTFVVARVRCDPLESSLSPRRGNSPSALAWANPRTSPRRAPTPRSAIASNCAFPGLFSRRYVTKHTFRFRRPETVPRGIVSPRSTCRTPSPFGRRGGTPSDTDTT